MAEVNNIMYNFSSDYVFQVEKDFDNVDFFRQIKKYWHISIYLAMIYVFCVHYFRRYMENKKAFDLKIPLAVWNFCLAIFSIWGAYFRFVPEINYCLKTGGFMFSLCNDGYIHYNVMSYWVYLFAMSKIVELGDTAFIILRKRKLSFLHWFHHASALVSIWYSVAQENGSGKWFIGLNFVAHSLMYTYYFFMSLEYRFHKGVSIFITSIQLIQMVLGLYFNYVCYLAIQNSNQCFATVDNIIVLASIYTIYFCLFAQFFWTSYIFPSNNQGMKKVKKN